MVQNRLDNVQWYYDSKSIAEDGIGVYYSYIGSLLTCLKYAGVDVDPVFVLGAGGFAFRIWVEYRFCPSAMSIFDWNTHLPEAVRQAGYGCTHISRIWHETYVEEQRRLEAHEAIKASIDSKIPAIAWDIGIPEWGLVTGYNDDKEEYEVLSVLGQQFSMPYKELGKREIPILSVTTIGKPNNRDKAEVIKHSIEIAINHARQREYQDRPNLQDGLPAYILWASLFDMKNRNVFNEDFNQEKFLWTANYYACTYYSFRSYAHKYLKILAEKDERFIQAAECYRNVADCLKEVWELCSKQIMYPQETLLYISRKIIEAGQYEERGIECLEAIRF